MTTKIKQAILNFLTDKEQNNDNQEVMELKIEELKGDNFDPTKEIIAQNSNGDYEKVLRSEYADRRIRGSLTMK